MTCPPEEVHIRQGTTGKQETTPFEIYKMKNEQAFAVGQTWGSGGWVKHKAAGGTQGLVTAAVSPVPAQRSGVTPVTLDGPLTRLT